MYILDELCIINRVSCISYRVINLLPNINRKLLPFSFLVSQKKNSLYIIHSANPFYFSWLNIAKSNPILINATNLWSYFAKYRGTDYLYKHSEYISSKTFIFKKYNFFDVLPKNDLIYIYLDRYLLSIFLTNFSNIWYIDKFFSNISRSTLFNPLRSIYAKKNSLIACLLFLLKGWLSLFAYCVYMLTSKQSKNYLN